VKKTFKAVLPNVAADYEGVINFSTDKVTVQGKVYSTSEYCTRIAGILAGLSLSRSATYLVLNEVEAIEESENPDDAMDLVKDDIRETFEDSYVG